MSKIQRYAQLWLIATGACSISFKAVRLIGLHGTVGIIAFLANTIALLLAVGYLNAIKAEGGGGERA